MKQLRSIFLLGTFALLLFGCSKDEEFSILGKWNIDKITMSYYQGSTLVQTMSQVDSPDNDLGWVEFKDGGTGSDNEGGTFTWTLSGSNLTVVTDNETLALKLTTKEKKKLVGEATETINEGEATYTLKTVIELSR
ncbi:MAG: hypothetical protein ACPLXM_02820 [Bacteroidales bacterium]